jgi:hypothetical protein
MRKTPEQKRITAYLHKLRHEHRALNRMIDTTKSIGASDQVKALKRLRLRLKDKITALQNTSQGSSLQG